MPAIVAAAGMVANQEDSKFGKRTHAKKKKLIRDDIIKINSPDILTNSCIKYRFNEFLILFGEI